MIRYRLDTNILIRFLTQDDPVQSPQVSALFQQASQGECLLVIIPPVLIETIWVLESVFKHPSKKIAKSLASLVVKPGIRCEEGPVTLDALYRYGQHQIDIVDCFLAAQSAAHGDAVATFDQDFKKFSDVQLWTPESP